MKWAPVLGAVLLACRPEAPSLSPPGTRAPVPVRATAPSLEASPSAVQPALADRLDTHAVTDRDFVRTRLYTWTTRESVSALRQTGRLLTADASTGGRASPYSRLVAELAETDPVAALLRDDPGLVYRRYAWPSPFATVLGRGPRRYGTALIEIELREDALLGRLDPSQQPAFTFVDGGGHPVPLDEVLREPHRIGAIFHVQLRPDLPVAFREYVVCNEEMVDRWSVATTAIATRVTEEIAMLEALAEAFAGLRTEHTRWPAGRRWTAAAGQPSLLTSWHRALAFDSVGYRPTPDNLATIVAALRGYDAGGPPLVVTKRSDTAPRESPTPSAPPRRPPPPS